MRLKRGVPVVVAAAMLAVAGCGGDDSGSSGGGGEPLSRSELVKEAQSVCKRYDATDLGSPDLDDPKQAEQYFAKARKLAQKQVDDLEDLDPAKSVKADFKAFTSAQQDAVDLLDDIVKAAKAKDREKGLELLQQFQPAAKDIEQAAKKLGITGC